MLLRIKIWDMLKLFKIVLVGRYMLLKIRLNIMMWIRSLKIMLEKQQKLLFVPSFNNNFFFLGIWVIYIVFYLLPQ